MGVDLLSFGTNDFVIINDDKSFVDALKLLQRERGNPHWFLFVDIGSGEYLAERFDLLQNRIQETDISRLNIPIGEIKALLSPIKLVEHNASINDLRKLLIDKQHIGYFAICMSGVPISIFSEEHLKDNLPKLDKFNISGSKKSRFGVIIALNDN